MTTNEDRTVIKLSSPSDIVTAMPVLIGFHPAESLAVMCLRGPRRRIGLTMRMDLPDPEHVDVVAEDLAHRAERDDAETIVAVCYTEAPDVDGDLPRRDLIDSLTAALERRNIGRLELLLVRGGRWYSYVCTRECCPREGTPIKGTPSSELLALEARAALDGHVVLDSREELEATIRGPVAAREATLRASYQRIGESFFDEVAARGAGHALLCTLELARAAYERFLGGDHELPDEEAVRILVGLEDKLARDELLTWGLDGHAEELIVFLSTLARCALDDNAAPICSALACVAYQTGNGALTNIAVERALRSEPDYELARLIDVALQAQIEPAEIRAMAERTRDRLREWGIGRTDAEAA
ncbi:MAG TPA: DUF4192 domain-containing protein [Jiangellaceae bacterium]